MSDSNLDQSPRERLTTREHIRTPLQVTVVQAMFELRLARHPRFDGLDEHRASLSLKRRFISPTMAKLDSAVAELALARATYAAMYTYLEATMPPHFLPRGDGQLEAMEEVIKDLGGELPDIG